MNIHDKQYILFDNNKNEIKQFLEKDKLKFVSILGECITSGSTAEQIINCFTEKIVNNIFCGLGLENLDILSKIKLLTNLKSSGDILTANAAKESGCVFLTKDFHAAMYAMKIRCKTVLQVIGTDNAIAFYIYNPDVHVQARAATPAIQERPLSEISDAASSVAQHQGRPLSEISEAASSVAQHPVPPPVLPQALISVQPQEQPPSSIKYRGNIILNIISSDIQKLQQQQPQSHLLVYRSPEIRTPKLEIIQLQKQASNLEKLLQQIDEHGMMIQNYGVSGVTPGFPNTIFFGTLEKGTKIIGLTPFGQPIIEYTQDGSPISGYTKTFLNRQRVTEPVIPVSPEEERVYTKFAGGNLNHEKPDKNTKKRGGAKTSNIKFINIAMEYLYEKSLENNVNYLERLINNINNKLSGKKKAEEIVKFVVDTEIVEHMKEYLDDVHILKYGYSTPLQYTVLRFLELSNIDIDGVPFTMENYTRWIKQSIAEYRKAPLPESAAMAMRREMAGPSILPRGITVAGGDSTTDAYKRSLVKLYKRYLRLVDSGKPEDELQDEFRKLEKGIQKLSYKMDLHTKR
jgi:hypothetical protein